MSTPLEIVAEWDVEAGVWVATSDDIPGLVTEAETMEVLLARLRIMIPELLALNGMTQQGDIPFRLRSERLEHVRAA
ncbi:MAG: DUF1902 domain-containing protein [Candidatus Moduliflexus flocculans]|nr:DUF1902 domain-containing protein [Candidatus Moduliflexus flocculans]